MGMTRCRVFRGFAAWIRVMVLPVVVSALCSHLPLAAGEEDPQPPWSDEQFMVVEEFSEEGGFWFSAMSEVDLARQRGNRYAFTARSTSYVGSGSDRISTVFQKGNRTVTAIRDPRTEKIDVVGGASLFVDEVNRVLDDLQAIGKLPSGYWELDVPILASEATGFAGPDCAMSWNVEEIRDSSRRGTYLLIGYSGKSVRYDVGPGLSVEQSFYGFAVMDRDKSHTYYSACRYSGTVIPQRRSASMFEGQQVIYRLDPDTRAAYLNPGDFPVIEEILESYPRINRSGGRWEDRAAVAAPSWFPPVWTVARNAQNIAGTIGERQTNLLPLVAVFVGAHIVDGVYTFAANVAHDVAGMINDTPGADLNPFDGDIASPLGKVYETAARGYAQTAADLGYLDPGKVDAVAEIGGEVLHLPGRILSITSSAPQFFGSAAHMTGVAKWATVHLGKFAHLSERFFSTLYGSAANARLVDIAELLRDGYGLGEKIVATALDRPTIKPPEPPPAASGGGGKAAKIALIAGGGAVGVGYLVKKAIDEAEEVTTPTPTWTPPTPTSYGSFSDISVNSRNITVRVWDHGQVDGDRIRITLNGSTIVSDHTLKGPPGTTFNLSLGGGGNSFKITALNEGTVSPNTTTIEFSNVTSGSNNQELSLDMNTGDSITITAP